MATPYKRVYLFISSTFNDMHAERDYLVKRVLPRLRDWCEKRRLRFIDIDLRWGLTESDSESKKIVELCLEYIDKSRPFFLCFQGQRYGWVPEKKDLSEATFTSFPDILQALEEGRSVTEMEILHGVIQSYSAEKEDPCQHAFFYYRDPSYLAEIPADPPALKPIYSDPSGSASEANLRQLKDETIRETGLPIRTYSTTWNGSDHTPELTLPLECSAILKSHQEDWRRRWKETADVNIPEGALTVPESEKEKAISYNERFTKGRLGNFTCDEKSLEDAIFEDFTRALSHQYQGHTEVTEESPLEKELAQQEEFIYAASEGFIQRGDEFDDLNAYADGDSSKVMALVAEAGMGKSTLLANWVEKRRQKGDTVLARFVGMSDGSHTVDNVIRYLLEEMRERGLLEGEIPLDPKEVRESWKELMEPGEAGTGEETGTSKLKWKSTGKTIIAIDALNQLQSGLRNLYWLPRELPSHIKLVISFKTDDADGKALYERYQKSGHIELARVKPFESLDDRKKLVQEFLRQYLKELDDVHIQALIESEGARNPLFLKVVLSELRVFGSFSQLGEKIRKEFGDSPRSAFQGVLRRLESDPAHSPLKPMSAVPMLFGLLSHARYGLSVEELCGIFVEEWEKMTNVGAKGIRPITPDHARDAIELYLRQLKPFLARRGGRHDFFYESFLLAARERYTGEGDVGARNVGARFIEPATSEAGKTPGMPTTPESGLINQTPTAWHSRIATYFLAQATTNIRKLSELPYHLSHAERHEELLRTLTDIDYLQAKSEAGMVNELAQDLDRALGNLTGELGLPEDVRIVVYGDVGVSRETLRLIRKAIELDRDFLRRRGDHLFPCLWNRLYWYDCPECEKHYDVEEGSVPVWKREGEKVYLLAEKWRGCWEGGMVLPGDGGADVLTGRGTKFCARQDQDSRGTKFCARQDQETENLSIHSQPPILQPPSIAGEDGSLSNDSDGLDSVQPLQPRPLQANPPLYLKSLRPTEPHLTSPLLQILRGHEDQVRSVSYSSDGKRIASGSGDNTVRVWDGEGGECLHTLKGHEDQVNSVSYSSDGKRIASGSMDNTVRVWDGEGGECLHTLKGHEGTVYSVSYSSDGKRIASGSLDKTVRVWDSLSGECLEVIKGGGMEKIADTFAHAEERGFRAVPKAPLETEVQTPDGKAICYFPAVLDEIATAPGGRIAGGIGNDVVLLEIVGGG